MPDKLASYRSKRDFTRTSEPFGDKPKSFEGLRYVMHKHAASHDHFDLRLEYEGVLRSWAVPKGPSLKPGEKRLAVEVEDHPLEYGDFEGVIPEHEYGGGTVMLWDQGTWEPTKPPTEDRLDFLLHGEKLAGHWTLIRTREQETPGKKSAKQWLFIKRTDNNATTPGPAPPENRSVTSGRTMEQIARGASPSDQDDQGPMEAGSIRGSRKDSLPSRPPVQLAALRETPPEGDAWIHELKFDGYRLLAKLEGGRATLLTRNSKDWTPRLPGIRAALEKLPVSQAILDGELVAPEADGSTSFRKLQEYLSSRKSKPGRIAYQVFDLLYLNDHTLLETPLLERKRTLSRLLEANSDPLIRYSDHVQGQGGDFFKEVCELGLEGAVSKKADAGYQSGRRPTWIKTKCTQQGEFVVGGYIAATGKRRGFRSLLLGTYDGDQLIYAGRVGSGFSSRQLTNLHNAMKAIETETAPFSSLPGDTQGAHWVEPEIVVDVAFTETTNAGVLRHPVFRGLREDKAPGEVQNNSDGSQNNSAHAISQKRSPPRRNQQHRPAGVAITNPDRVLYPNLGITKMDLARYYEELAHWILPHLRNRPLSMLRCPEGLSGGCFFQKHPDNNFARDVPWVSVPEKRGGITDYVYVRSATDLVTLVQYGVLEFHPWGCRTEDLERPDTLVFDLDPGPDLPWRMVAEAATSLRERLETLGLNSFLQATGGKGVHLIVPIVPDLSWERIKAFTQAVSRAHAREMPNRFTTNMAKNKRRGKLFIDYLRNGRGNTSIARYSTRARDGAGVATPLRWDELNTSAPANRYTINNLRRRLGALKKDPWSGYEDARREISQSALIQFNLEYET